MSRRPACLFAVTSTLTVALASTGGCGTIVTSGTGGGGTGGASSSTITTTSGSTSTPTMVASSSTSSGGGTGGTGGMPTTIEQIAMGAVGPKTPVSVSGVVVVSPKFLVSQSKTTGACLWGVVVSSPGLVEAAPFSGTLLVSYGAPSQIPDGGTKAVCPVLGQTPSGDGIPDEVAVGDVVDVTGKVDVFVPACPGGVPEIQIADILPGGVTKVGTAVPPAAHILGEADLTSLAMGDPAVVQPWTHVLVRAQNVAATPQATGDGGTSIIDGFGDIILMGSGLPVGDRLYDNAQLAPTDVDHQPPLYSDPATMFAHIDGVVLRDLCAVTLDPPRRCVDLAPPSSNCP